MKAKTEHKANKTIDRLRLQLGRISLAKNSCIEAEAALQDSEELLKRLVGKSLVGMFIIKDAGFIYVNSRFAKIFGYTQDELLQLKSVAELAAPGSRAKVKKSLRGEEKTERFLHYTFHGLRKDAQHVECEVLGSRISFNGSIAVIGTTLDITKRKNMEQSLHLNQTRLKLMQRISSSMRMRVSLDERIKRTLNAIKGSFREFWLFYAIVEPSGKLKIVHSIFPGNSDARLKQNHDVVLPAKFLGRVQPGHPIIIKAVANKLRLQPFANIANAFQVKSALQIPLQHSRKQKGLLCLISDKERCWEAHEVQVMIEIGDYLAIAIKDAQTQHARKVAVERLKKSEERLRKVVQNMPVMVSALGPDGTIALWNRECERVTGYRAEEIISNPGAFKLLYPDVDLRCAVLEELSVHDHDYRHHEWELTDINGNVKTIAWSSISKRFPISGWSAWSVGVDVTERKQAESRVKESNEKYRTLFQESRDSIYISNADGLVVNANEAFLTYFRYDDNVLGKLKVKQLYAESSDWDELRQQLALHGSIKNQEVRLRSNDGTETFGLLSCTNRISEAGDCLGHQGTIHDITLKKQSEDALRHVSENVAAFTGEAFFNSLVKSLCNSLDMEYALVGELLLQKKGTIRTIAIHSNGGAIDNVEYRVKQTPSAKCIKDSFCIFTSELQKKYPTNRFLKEIGVQSYVGTRLCDSRGRTMGILEIMDTKPIQNVELAKSIVRVFAVRAAAELERKRAEAAQRESEEKYRLVVQTASEAILIIQRGKVKFFNQQATELTGYSQEELLKKTLIELVHDEEKAAVRKHLKNLRNTGVAGRIESFRLVRKSGQVKSIDASFVSLNWDGAPAKLCFMYDVSDRKNLQEELARAQRLESAGRVAGQIAHDFNNLLSPLTAYPALIREELDEDHPVVAMVTAMEECADKLAQINQQLLTLGRRGHYTMEPIDLNELIYQVVTSRNFSAKITIVEAISKELHPIKGGQAQLSRALVNLLSNAVEAMNHQGQLTIKTENVQFDEPQTGFGKMKGGKFVKLQICDQGCGIEPKSMARIFEPFFTTKRMDKERGSGLGLSVVNGIVEDHGGHISVESKVGSGTTFTILFPVAKNLLPADKAPARKIVGGRERILVVDDDPMQCKVARNLLKRLGYTVDVLASGEMAVRQVGKVEYDLLVLDMDMGAGIDGTEAYRQILEFQPEQKAIVLSGYAMTDRVQQALRLGAGSFVPKPISQTALAEATRRELDKKRNTKLRSRAQ